jgi:hypothetical protein
MDWIIYETVAPRLQPIYEEIAASGATLASFMNESTPPAEVADHHNRIAQCINSEVSRSQAIVDVLAGNSTATVPERTADPCIQVNGSVEAIQTFINSQ